MICKNLKIRSNIKKLYVGICIVPSNYPRICLITLVSSTKSVLKTNPIFTYTSNSKSIRTNTFTDPFLRHIYTDHYIERPATFLYINSQKPDLQTYTTTELDFEPSPKPTLTLTYLRCTGSRLRSERNDTPRADFSRAHKFSRRARRSILTLAEHVFNLSLGRIFHFLRVSSVFRREDGEF